MMDLVAQRRKGVVKVTGIHMIGKSTGLRDFQKYKGWFYLVQPVDAKAEYRGNSQQCRGRKVAP